MLPATSRQVPAAIIPDCFPFIIPPIVVLPIIPRCELGKARSAEVSSRAGGLGSGRVATRPPARTPETPSSQCGASVWCALDKRTPLGRRAAAAVPYPQAQAQNSLIEPLRPDLAAGPRRSEIGPGASRACHHVRAATKTDRSTAPDQKEEQDREVPRPGRPGQTRRRVCLRIIPHPAVGARRMHRRSAPHQVTMRAPAIVDVCDRGLAHELAVGPETGLHPGLIRG